MGALKCQLQKEFELEEYDTLIGLNEDYLTQIIQFGYVVIFAGALPFSPFMMSVHHKFLIFMGSQYIMGFLVMILFDTAVDEKAPIQQKRNHFIVPLIKKQESPEEGHNYDPNTDEDKSGTGCIEQLI